MYTIAISSEFDNENILFTSRLFGETVIYNDPNKIHCNEGEEIVEILPDSIDESRLTEKAPGIYRTNQVILRASIRRL